MNGELFDTGDTISYYSGSTLVSMAGTIVRGTSVIPDEIYAGNVFEVSHYNHGMHSNSNIVKLVVLNQIPLLAHFPLRLYQQILQFLLQILPV